MRGVQAAHPDIPLSG